MFTLYVGVDISKDTFSCTGLHNKAEKRFCLTASMNRNGFAELLETIRNHCSETSSVLVGMESTGCYHVNLYSFLAAHDIKTVVINPLLINNFAKLSLRKTKTDKKDSLLIAQFLVLNTTALSAVSVSEDHRDHRELARERESISHLIATTKTEIRQALHRTFPELSSLCNVFSRGMLEFLKAFPSAESERAAELAPNAADSFFNSGIILRFAGRARDATVPAFERAIRMNPIPPASYLYQLALSYTFVGEFEKAVRLCKEALIKNPDDLVGRVTLIVAYGSLGREQEAKAQVSELHRVSQVFPGAGCKNMAVQEGRRQRIGPDGSARRGYPTSHRYLFLTSHLLLCYPLST